MVTCEPLLLTPQVIHCRVLNKTTSEVFLCSFVYGLHTVVHRKDLWSSLISWGINHFDPWVILGDFNSIISPNERRGSNPPTHAEMEDFISCVTTLGLEDVNSIGNFYTWTNGSVWTKLDRVLINSDWQSSSLCCTAEFLESNSLSDHTPILVLFQPTVRAFNKPFKFLNMWVTHPKFSTVLRESWHIPVFGTKQYKLSRKLKRLKSPFRSLILQAFSHISERVSKAQDEFSVAHSALMRNPSSDELKLNVKLARSKANFLLEAERKFLLQKNKSQNLLFADRGTKYFHNLMKKKSSCNFIPALVKPDGSSTSSQDEVINELLAYYSNLLGKGHNVTHIDEAIFAMGPVLTQSDREALGAPIDDDQIKQALFHI